MTGFISRNKSILILFGVLAVFLLLRLPALSQPYHQDEYKWPIIVNPALTEPGGIPHPPVGEFIYRKLGQLVGYDNFRVIPLLFSIANFFLLFYLSKSVFDTRVALWTVGLFSVVYYSVLASVMVDTDGAIMPFFALLAFIGYYKLRGSSYEVQRTNWKWLVLLCLGVVCGFLTKISFMLVPAALVIDFVFEKQLFKDKRKLLKYAGFGLLSMVGLVGILLLSKLIFPSFNLQSSLRYWEHFANFSNRGWLQTFIQFAKAMMYTSPLLLVTLLLVDKEIFKKTRLFFIFIILGAFFYLIAFDFSTGALDRYFQFLVVPLCIISGAVIAKIFSSEGEGICKSDIVAVSIISLGIFALQFFEQAVPPLYPKTEWVSWLVSFKWNFLFPFTGGSGPLPFYVSFQFIALLWLVSLIFTIVAFFNKSVIKRSLFAVLVFGFLYNAMFAEEYLFGRINGSAQKLVSDAVLYIKNHPTIKTVAVYNDNGGYAVMQSGKYARRIYATPQFEPAYKEFFSKFSGHILYVNIPRVGEDTVYQKYFNSCSTKYEVRDKYITSKIFYCPNTNQ